MNPSRLGATLDAGGGNDTHVSRCAGSSERPSDLPSVEDLVLDVGVLS